MKATAIKRESKDQVRENQEIENLWNQFIAQQEVKIFESK